MTWKGEKQRHQMAARGVKTKLGGPVIEKNKYRTHRKISGFDVVDARYKDGVGTITVYAFGKGVFGGDITISSVGYKSVVSKVNWASIGSQPPEKAKLYAEALKLAARISERINKQQGD